MSRTREERPRTSISGPTANELDREESNRERARLRELEMEATNEQCHSSFVSMFQLVVH